MIVSAILDLLPRYGTPYRADVPPSTPPSAPPSAPPVIPTSRPRSMSKPKSSMSKDTLSFPSSSFSLSGSHSEHSPALLSASRKASSCSSVRSSATMHGTFSIFSFLAASRRVCPATTTPSPETTTGTLKPNSFMLFFTNFTEPAFFLGLFSYGTSSDMFLYCIFSSSMPFPFPRAVPVLVYIALLYRGLLFFRQQYRVRLFLLVFLPFLVCHLLYAAKVWIQA